jgi:hypothetical protein
VDHQGAYKVHVARQPVELGDDDRTLELAGGLYSGGELRAAVERVGTLAALDLDIFGALKAQVRPRCLSPRPLPTVIWARLAKGPFVLSALAQAYFAPVLMRSSEG